LNTKPLTLTAVLSLTFLVFGSVFSADDSVDKKFTGNPIEDRVVKEMKYLVTKEKKITIYIAHYKRNNKEQTITSEKLNPSSEDKQTITYKKFGRHGYRPVMELLEEINDGKRRRTENRKRMVMVN